MKALRRLIQILFPPKTKPASKPYPYPPFVEELARNGLTFDRWLERISEKPRIYGNITNDVAETVKRVELAHFISTIIDAERILEHRFQLLGSNPYVPIDPDRSPRSNGYIPIDWALDPIRNARFPNDVPCKEWDLFKMRPPNADIKLPWELGRCQHWVTLGQAFRLTNESRYAIEIANQTCDFLEANPIGIGIDWTCTMDAAIRAANWAIAFDLIRTCPELPDSFLQSAYDALFGHGIFIFNNLENTYEVTSNHFLSNVVGLFFLASVFSDTSQGKEWNIFCRNSLEKEITVQVYDEGADYESSLPYHRLVTELFMSAARLAELHGQPLSTDYQEKLRKMVLYSLSTLRPDGLTPQIGDADDGRLHIFTDYAGWNPQDARHLPGPASFLFNESEWLDSAGRGGTWEAIWWGFDCPPKISYPSSLPPVSKLFPESGLAVVRNGGNFLIISNGKVGTAGFGNHKHNELLSFECCLNGVPLIVDPGSFVYTSDFDARNLFRGTGYHNTLRIDSTEQNELQSDYLFRLFEKAEPEHICFDDAGEWVEYRGLHKGYQRLESPVIHERRFRFHKESGLLMILDVVKGDGEHLLEWHFHFDPAIGITEESEGRFSLNHTHCKFQLITPKNLGSIISSAYYSPSYGVRIPCKALDFQQKIDLNGLKTYPFFLKPNTVSSDELEATFREWQDV